VKEEKEGGEKTGTAAPGKGEKGGKEKGKGGGEKGEAFPRPKGKGGGGKKKKTTPPFFSFLRPAQGKEREKVF